VLLDIQTIGALVPQTTAVIYFPHIAPKKTSLKEIAEMLAHVAKHMATKDDLAAVETRLDHHIDKLDAKLDRLDTKLTKFEEHEIDKRFHFTTPYDLLKIMNNQPLTRSSIVI
jgi:uncharacterized coiled-coil protein SlyX